MKNIAIISKVINIYFIILCFNGLNAQIINEYVASNTNNIEDAEGETGDWIEIYNNQNVAIPLQGYSLTDDIEHPQKWIFPDVEIQANAYLLIWATGKNVIIGSGEIHTNFKIKSAGEALFLYSPAQVLIDETPARYLDTNISLGKIPADLSNWYYFETPTPGMPNSSNYHIAQAQMPIFSKEGGVYEAAITVALTPEHPNDDIRYTLDGSLPSENSALYVTPFNLESNTALRVKVYRQDALPSPIFTNTYIFDNDINLRIICISTAPENFFGNTGIYDHHTSGEERPVHVEYYEKDKTLGFELDMGVKIHAPDARSQKSLRLYARGKYGTKMIDYRIFEDKEIEHFRGLVLRNGGNDGMENKKTQIRDALVHRLYQQQNSENAMASYQPVHLYLNGQYWGIYNLRERQDEHYLASNFGYEKEEVDFLEYDYAEPFKKKTISGDWDNWEALKAFLINEDLSTAQHYETVKNWMDIDNFIDYQIFEIFIGNQDWLNNNIKFWRPNATGGKWKWVLWDTEYGLGTQRNYPVGQPDFNFLQMAISWGGWGNGDYTWMLRNLLANESFKQRFILRYLDLLNTTFLVDYNSQQFDYLANEIVLDVHKQFERWPGCTQQDWENDLTFTRNFISQRPYYCRNHLATKFELDDNLYHIELDVSNIQAGNIKINTLFIDEHTLGWQNQPYPWRGEYFQDYEIQIEAIPMSGYHFVYWEGISNAENSVLTLSLTEDTYLKAIFEPNSEVEMPQLFINEIMAFNSNVNPDESGAFEDWIEIYNAGDTPINLAGLFFTDDLDEPLKWKIPNTDLEITTVAGGEYITFFADDDVDKGVLHLNFKLKKEGENLALFFKTITGTVVLVDKVTFPVLAENVSFGRLPDGAEEWVVFDISTPNDSNQIINGSKNQEILEVDVLLYPNPVSHLLNIKIEEDIHTEHLLKVFDGNGRQVQMMKLYGKEIYQLDISSLPAGLYVISISSSAQKKAYFQKITIQK